jgi:hypothetical protein
VSAVEYACHECRARDSRGCGVLGGDRRHPPRRLGRG